MNIRKKLAAWLDPTPERVSQKMYELMLKAGRRCAHDFAHCADELSLRQRDEIASELHRRSREWVKVFYPDGGPKDYHTTIVKEYESEIGRLSALLREHGIDPHDGDIPF